MNLPKLPREPIRPEKEPEADDEIWYPDWQCFCCHDSGIITPLLTRFVIPDYELNRDKQPACYRCAAGSPFIGCEHYDQRFNRGICNELDKIERENWTQTIKAKQKRIRSADAHGGSLDLKKLAKEFAMPGTLERTANDEREIQQRQQVLQKASG